MKEQLKPCPFCGGKAFIRQNKDAMKTYSAYCGNEDCSASPKISAYGKEMAIDLWNTRKPIDKVVEQLEKRSNEEGAEWVRLQRSEEVRQVSNTDIHSYASSCYDDAIKIVKGGAK